MADKRTVPAFAVFLSGIFMHGKEEPNPNFGALGPLAVFAREIDAKNYVKCGRRQGFLPPGKGKGLPKVTIVQVEIAVPEAAFSPEWL